MRLFYTNLIDVSGVGITASSQQSGLPATNVATELKKRVWQTGTSTAAEYVTFDLGSAQAATSMIVLNHNLTASDSLIQVRGSTDNFSASNVLVGTLTFSSGVMSVTFNSASYRYWRFAFTKSAAGQTRDVGRIFLGNYVDTVNPDFEGYEKTYDDLSIKQKSIGGQKYTDVRQKMRMIRFDFSGLSTTEKDKYLTLFETVGIGKSFFVQVASAGDPAGAEMAEVLYMDFKSEPSFKVDGVDAWKFKIDLEESL